MPTDDRDYVQKIKAKLSKKEKALKYGQGYKQKWLEANARHLGGAEKAETALKKQDELIGVLDKKRYLETEPFSEDRPKKPKIMSVVTTVEEARKKRLHKLIAEEGLKGYVSVKTNVGDLNFEVFCHLAPVASENFLGLCAKGYYHNVRFHRLVPGFMIQGGDPAGSGRGGESLWGEPFDNEIVDELSHDKVGVLSMANTGKPKTNKSQFFITFAPCTHLDGKHTVFGKLVGGMKVLKQMEATPTNELAQPKTPLVILQTVVHENPFETAAERLKAAGSSSSLATTSAAAHKATAGSGVGKGATAEIAVEDNPYLQHLKRK